MSDGFFTPSTVMVLANNEDLGYQENIKNAKSTVLFHLLRAYEGLFIEDVKIDEARMARYLNMAEDEVVRILRICHVEGLIIYKRKSSQNTITFTRERPHESDFSIDKKLYEQRVKLAQKRINAIIQLMESTTVCRQKLILDYFNEASKTCGKCDICLRHLIPPYSKEIYDRVINHIGSLIKEKPLKIQDYIRLYPLNKRSLALKIIQHFEDEQVLKVHKDGKLEILKKKL